MVFQGSEPVAEAILAKVVLAADEQVEVDGESVALRELHFKLFSIGTAASEISYVLRHKRVFVLKQEVGTIPRFFYFFDT